MFLMKNLDLLLNKEKIISVALIPFSYHNKPVGALSLGSHSMDEISDPSKIS